MKTSFEQYLEQVFWDDYHGDKEGFESAFDNWLSNLDVQKVIDFAGKWAEGFSITV
jgi:hypothetical protein